MRTRIRSIAAIALMGVMCLGSVCHFWHHLVDPACGAGGGRHAEPCATCSALHGAGIAPRSEIVTAPRAVPVSEVALFEADDPVAPPALGGTPRAPPVA